MSAPFEPVYDDFYQAGRIGELEFERAGAVSHNDQFRLAMTRDAALSASLNVPQALCVVTGI